MSPLVSAPDPAVIPDAVAAWYHAGMHRRLAMTAPIAALVLCLSLPGCRDEGEPKAGTAGSATDSDAATTEAADPGTVLTDRGGFRVTRRTDPSPIPLNALYELEIVVEDAAGGDAGAIEVAVDADMPAHGHGMNTAPEVEALGDGRYRVRGMQFHMPGYWETWIDVTRDGITERATFPDEIGRAR